MKKFLGYILTPIVLICYMLTLCIFHPAQWVAYKFFGYSAHKRVVDVLNLCLTRCLLLSGNTVSFTNNQGLPVGRPIIFIANHQSLLDIPPLIWYLRKYHAKFVSKIELTKGIPSVSFNLKYGGAANIDRKDQRQSIMEMMKLGQKMKENKWSAVIFPEGTRSKNGRVKPFRAAGVATILKKCPEALLVPIVIRNSWAVVKYGYYPLNTFTRMSLEVLAPIEPGKVPAEELVLKVEDNIRAALGQEPAKPFSVEEKD
jgi:1-acyl-sn-glycerol-3-phosphate acyltransferase